MDAVVTFVKGISLDLVCMTAVLVSDFNITEQACRFRLAYLLWTRQLRLGCWRGRENDEDIPIRVDSNEM